jgi:glc operon protein GlcG
MSACNTRARAEDARRVLDVVVAEVSLRGKAAVIVVADSHGELIAFVRMDGAPLSSIAIATNKAWTAARAGKSTGDIGKKASTEQGFDIAYYGDSRFCGWGGGIPVRQDGRVIGSVAVSGMPQEEDVEVATLGAAAITAS